MILKLGYVDLHGISIFRYIENFTELRIVSFLKESYRYHIGKDIIIYDEKHEILNTEKLFNSEILKKNKVEYMNVTHICFLDSQTKTYCSFACLSNSVFLMNENGKTIDKY